MTPPNIQRIPLKELLVAEITVVSTGLKTLDAQLVHHGLEDSVIYEIMGVPGSCQKQLLVSIAYNYLCVAKKVLWIDTLTVFPIHLLHTRYGDFSRYQQFLSCGRINSLSQLVFLLSQRLGSSSPQLVVVDGFHELVEEFKLDIQQTYTKECERLDVIRAERTEMNRQRELVGEPQIRFENLHLPPNPKLKITTVMTSIISTISELCSLHKVTVVLSGNLVSRSERFLVGNSRQPPSSSPPSFMDSTQSSSQMTSSQTTSSQTTYRLSQPQFKTVHLPRFCIPISENYWNSYIDTRILVCKNWDPHSSKLETIHQAFVYFNNKSTGKETKMVRFRMKDGLLFDNDLDNDHDVLSSDDESEIESFMKDYTSSSQINRENIKQKEEEEPFDQEKEKEPETHSSPFRTSPESIESHELELIEDSDEEFELLLPPAKKQNTHK